MPTAWPDFRTSVPPPYALTTATGTSNENSLVRPLVAAFDDAMAERGNLRPEAFRVHGFSGRKFRRFLNNLMPLVPNANYLEIGLFHGASFCSAISGNTLRAVGIDNWTEYGGKRDLFEKNLAALRTESSDIEIIERDFRTIDYKSMTKMNIMFYDGSHDEKDQYDGIYIPQPAMADSYIMIVDDWNWKRVRKGTLDAIRDAGISIDYQIEVRTTFGGENLPLVHGMGSEWHNGCFAAAVTKRR